MPSKRASLDSKPKNDVDKQIKSSKKLTPQEEELLNKLGKKANKQEKQHNTGKKITVVVTSALLAAATLTIPAVIYYTQNKGFTITIETVAKDIEDGKITLKLKKGATLRDITVPNRPGYYFAGFYSDKVLSNQLSLDTKVTKDSTIYLYYILINYNFKIDSPFADHLEIQDVKGNPLDIHSSLHHGDRFVVIASTPEENEQTVLQVFGAVKTDETTANGDPIYEIVADNKTADDKEIRIYYDERIKTFDVWFLNEDGGQISSQQVQYGSSANYLGDIPTKPKTTEHQYSFKGWLLAEFVDGEYKPILDEFGEQQHLDKDELANYQIKKDTYLIAEFTESYREYDLNISIYDNDYSKLTITSSRHGLITNGDKVEWGDTLTIVYDDDESDGYHCSKFEINGQAQENDAEYKVDGDVSIVFERAINEYTINFYDEGGKQPLHTIKVTHGAAAQIDFELPTKADDLKYSYKFDKWVDAHGGDMTDMLGNVQLDINGASLDVYASYTQEYVKYHITIVGENVTITFVSGASHQVNDPIHSGDTLYYGDKIKLEYEVTDEGHMVGTHTINGNDFNSGDVHEVKGNVNIVFSLDKKIYTVQFLDYDGAVLETKYVEHGEGVEYTGDKTPTRASDGEFDYTFSGWQGDLNNITQKTDFTPTFNQTYVEYQLIIPQHVTAKFLSGTSHTSEYQHNPHNELNKDYTNTTINVHKGDKLQITCQPSEGHHASELKLNGTDISFDGEYVLEISPVENKKYEITYKEDLDSITITFCNYDGETITTTQVLWGEHATFDQENPQRQSTLEYFYTFLGWSTQKGSSVLADLNSIEIKSETSFYAVYKENYQEYTLTITETKPENVKVTFVGGTSEIQKGSEINSGTKLHYNDQIKVEFTESTGYHKTTFTVGGKDFESGKTYKIQAETNIVYEETINTYQVHFYNYNGTQILQTIEVNHGGEAAYTLDAPTKPSSVEYDYTFIGWGSSVDAEETTILTNIICETNFYPVFSHSWREYQIEVPQHVTIKYLRGNSSYEPNTPITHEKPIHYGDFISISCTPSVGYKVKTFMVNSSVFSSGDEFEFKGELKIVYDEEILTFDVIFLDYDGQPLDTIKVNYDSAATYPQANPTREDDATYHYTFIGWGATPEAKEQVDLTHIKARTTVYALYSTTYVEYSLTIPDKVEVKFVSGNSNHQPQDVLTEQDKLYFGDVIKLSYKEDEGKQKSKFTVNGIDIENNGTFTLAGEIPNKNVNIIYEQTAKIYTVKFLDENGDVLQTIQVEHGKEAVFSGEKEPSKQADTTFSYIFKGWEGDLKNITGDTQFKPTFTAKYIEYSLVIPEHVNVKYLSGTSDQNLPDNDNHTPHTEAGHTYSNETITLHVGDQVEITCSPSEGYHYTKLEVNQNKHTPGATYTIKGATTIEYSQAINEYTLNFHNYNSDEIIYTTKVNHNEAASFDGDQPKREQTDTYLYKFAGWNTTKNATTTIALNKITRDMELYAVYTEEYREYTLTINNPEHVKVTYISGTSTESQTDGVYTSPHSPHNVQEITTDSTFHWGDKIKIEYTQTDGYKMQKFTVNGSNFTSGNPHTVNGDVDIVYEEVKNEFNVTFYDYDGQKVLDTIVVQYGGTAKYSKEEEPTREGNDEFYYTFKGWSTNKDTYIEANLTNITGETSFYAYYDEHYHLYTLTIQPEMAQYISVVYVSGTSGNSYSPQQTLNSGDKLHYHDVIAVSSTLNLQNEPETITNLVVQGAVLQEQNYSVEDAVSVNLEVSHSYLDLELIDCGYQVNGFKTDKSSANVIIPNTFIGTPVIAIKDSAFIGKENITQLTIGENITTIGKQAFYKCTGLTELTISANVVDLGVQAFKDCYNLELINYNATSVKDFSQSNYVFKNAGRDAESFTITIGENVQKIPAYLFYDCDYITDIHFNSIAVQDLDSNSKVFYNAGTSKDGITVIFGDTVQSIPSYLFYCDDLKTYAPKITSVTVGSNITSIGDYAFHCCQKLTEINLEQASRLQSIGKYAFTSCQNLSEIALPNSVTSIGENVFAGCNSLTSITIPDKVTEIKSNTFYGCTELTNVILPESITKIGNQAFGACYSLKEIKIPSAVEQIESSAFYSCDALAKVTIESETIYQAMTSAEECGNLIKKANTIIVPTDIVDDYDSSYIENADNFLKVSAGENYEFKKREATDFVYTWLDEQNAWRLDGFKPDNSMAELVIPDDYMGYKVVEIKESAFADNTGITSVSIGNNITTFGENAFAGCTALTELTFGKNISNLATLYLQEKGIFDDTVTLSTLKFTGTLSEWCTGFKNAELTQLATAGMEESGIDVDTIIPNADNISYMMLLDKTNYDYDNLSLYINNELITETLTIPEDVTVISGEAFAFYKKITGVVIGSSVTEIDAIAFRGCDNLTQVDMRNANSLQSIGLMAFTECAGLSSITINSHLTAIGAAAFAGCALTNVNMENATSLQIIGAMAFAGNANLAEITIPASVTKLGMSAFAECTGATRLNYSANIIDLIKPYLDDPTQLEYFPLPFMEDGMQLSTHNFVGTMSEWANGFKSEKLPFVLNALMSSDETIKGIENMSFWMPFGMLASNMNMQLLVNGEEISGSLHFDDSVTAIAAGAFTGQNITDVVIGANVTEIGYMAFALCENLSQVDMQNATGLLTIGTAAFANCISLTEIEIPRSVTTLGESAYLDCTSATKLTYSTNIADILRPYVNQDGPNTGSPFAGITTLREFDFKGTMAEWYKGADGGFAGTDSNVAYHYVAFSSFDNVKDLVLQILFNYETVKFTINGETLAENITVPGDVSAICCGAFALIQEIKTVTFEEGCTILGDGAFTLSLVQEVNLPNSLQVIGEGAFLSVLNLDNIVIPENVTTIRSNAFANFQGQIEVKSTKITVVEDFAFDKCKGLTNITLGEGLTEIGYDAFASSGLTKINLPNSLISIDGGAFSRCDSLTEITIPENVKSIDSGDATKAFSSCRNLATVTIKSKDIYQQLQSRRDCGELVYYVKTIFVPKEIVDGYENDYIDSLNYYLKLDAGDNYEFRSLESTYYMYTWLKDQQAWQIDGFRQGYIEENLTIPDQYMGFDVVSINASAFTNKRIRTLTIGKNIKEIGAGAFMNCYILNSIQYNAARLTNDMTMMPFSQIIAGNGTGQDVAITIGDDVQVIPQGLFTDLTHITKITFGKNVQMFAGDTFGTADGSKNLDAVYYTGTLSDWCQITRNISDEYGSLYIEGTKIEGKLVIPSDVTNIGEFAFRSRKEITEVELGENVASIDTGAFQYCANLTTVNFVGAEDKTNMLQTIGSGAFRGCGSLHKIVIPSNVTTIGGGEDFDNEWAVFYQTSIEEATIESPTITNAMKTVNDFGGLLRNATILYTLKSNGETSFLKENYVKAIGDYGNYFKWVRIGDNNLFDIQVMSDHCVIQKARPISTNFTIPDYFGGLPVTEIADDAFSNNQAPQVIKLGKNIEKIGDRAFSNCINISTMNFEQCRNLKSIGSQAFSGCRRLRSITGFEKLNYLTQIGNGAFSHTSIEEITIPNSVQSLGTYGGVNQGVFEGCTQLKTINISEQYSKLRYIGARAFLLCGKLNNLVIPTLVIGIGNNQTERNYAFDGCKSLTEITICSHSLLTSLYRQCGIFDLPSLTHIKIPRNVHVAIEAAAKNEILQSQFHVELNMMYAEYFKNA